MKLVKTAALILATGLVLGGCRQDNCNTGKAHLDEKYGDDYSYVGEGEQGINGETVGIFKDENGNEFQVQITPTGSQDNYESVVFDGSLEEYFQQLIPFPSIVFVSTESVYTGSGEGSASWQEYIKNCPLIKLRVWTTEEDMALNEIRDTMAAVSAAGPYTLSVEYFRVDATTIQQVQSFDHSIPEEKILLWGGMSLIEGRVSSCWWKEKI